MDKKKYIKSVKSFVFSILLLLGAYLCYQVFQKYVYQVKVLERVVKRLEADSRIAEVLVTDVRPDPATQKPITTIKFLEYDAQGKPLTPKSFTFRDNIIQFQSLVVRFDDAHVRTADVLRGKSIYLFWKVFVLDGADTQEFDIVKVDEVPDGYKIGDARNPFEETIWREFWSIALKPDRSVIKGIKNAQIEAPGMRFIPGVLYTLKIEHDGGIRIDAQEIPAILRGEKVLER